MAEADRIRVLELGFGGIWRVDIRESRIHLQVHRQHGHCSVITISHALLTCIKVVHVQLLTS
jgi:hypothetical protein